LDLFGSIGIGLLVFQAVGSFRIFRMFRILRLSGSLDLLGFSGFRDLKFFRMFWIQGLLVSSSRILGLVFL
jgi:hypothetical protein